MYRRFVLMINNTCNLNCRYCYQHHKPWEEVDPDIVKTYFPKEGDLVVHFLGGEPLMSWDYLRRLIEKITEWNPNAICGIVSNGHLLNDEIVDFCNKYDVAFDLSHDGGYHEITRGHDAIKANPDYYMKLKYKRMSSIANRDCFDFYKFWEFSKELCEYYKQPRIYHKIAFYKCNTTLDRDLMVQPGPEFEAMLDRVFGNMQSNLLKGEFDCYEFAQYRPMLETISTRFRLTDGCVTGSYCGVDTSIAHMDIFGNVYNCFISNQIMGKLGTPEGKAYNGYIHTEKCQSCDAFIWCGGGCFINVPEVKELECYTNKQQFYRLVNVLNELKNHNIEVKSYDRSKEFGRPWMYNLF